MPIQGIPKAKRADHLRGRLRPDRLLADLAAAMQPNRPFVELIGIKAQVSEGDEFDRFWVPEFKQHLQTDRAIQDQIRPYVEMGFRFRWTGYFDPTGIECCLAIERNALAERKLRSLVDGGEPYGQPDAEQPSLL